MNIKNLKRQGKNLVNWGTIGFFFLYALITFGISIASAFIPFVGPIISFATSLIAPAFMYKYVIDTCYQRKFAIDSVIPYLKDTVLVTVWLFIKLFLPYLAIIIFSVGGGFVFIMMGDFGTILFVLLETVASFFLIYLGISYSFCYYILFDERCNLTPKQCVAFSKELIKGHILDYVFLGLSFIPISILAMLPLGLGFIYVVPYVHFATAAFYYELTRLYNNNNTQPQQYDEYNY